MDIEDKMRRLSAHRDADKVLRDEDYRVQSKKKLQKTIETKINTTMIGAISAIEQKFGKLWGQGKSFDQLSPRELEMRTLKDELRTEILNNGNNQKRAAVSELNQYEVKWSRYHMDMDVRGIDANE